MSPGSPEEVAGDLLHACGQAEPPVKVELVVALLRGLNVSLEPLDNDGYIVDVPGGAEILVNSRASAVRRRFTLAHEIGHYALQIGLGDSSILSSDSDVERWCDRFAVGLLMPKRWIQEFLGEVSPERLAGRVASGPRTFEVSRPAFWFRVSEVGRIWVFELASDGKAVFGIRPTPPAEVLRLARTCAARTQARSNTSIAAYGFRASCVRLRSGRLGEERSLAVVATETPTLPFPFRGRTARA